MTTVGKNTTGTVPKRVKHGGRVAGTPNKATKEFRDTVTQLLQKNASNVEKWLQLVAEGRQANEDEGIAAVPGDPARALDLLTKLAEYAAPKLARTEHTGKDGAAIAYQRVERTIIDPTQQ